MRKRALLPAVMVPLPQLVQKTSKVYPSVLLPHAPPHTPYPPVPTPRYMAVLASQEKPRELSHVPGMGYWLNHAKLTSCLPMVAGPCLLHASLQPPFPSAPHQEHRALFVGMGPTFAEVSKSFLKASGWQTH